MDGSGRLLANWAVVMVIVVVVVGVVVLVVEMLNNGRDGVQHFVRTECEWLRRAYKSLGLKL